MLEGIEAVFFDMDGTLIDSMTIPPLIDRRFFSNHGVEVPPNLPQLLYGMSFTQACEFFKEKFGFKGTVQEIHDEWIDLAYKTYTEEAPIKNGAIEFLKSLRENKIKTAIVTSNSRQIAEGISKSNKIEDYLDAIFTSCDVEKAKPEPDVYLHAASNLNIDPSKCLVFEDTCSGILAGTRAGMRVCAIYDKSSEKEDDKKRELAHYYIKDFTDVINGTYEKLQ